MNEDTYVNKIQTLLTKVINGEEVYPKQKEIPENPLHKKLKEKGIKNSIIEIFTERYEVPSFITEESNDEIEGTKYYKINPPSSFSDADQYWNVISPHLKRMGKNVSFSSEKSGELNLKINDSPVKICLVRDSENGDKPTILFESDLPPEDIIENIERCGLKPDRLSAKHINKYLFIDIMN